MRTPIPFLLKYVVPYTERVGSEFLEFAVPEIADVVSSRKNSKTAAECVERQTLKNSWVVIAEYGLLAKSFQQNLQKKPVGRVEIFTNIPH